MKKITALLLALCMLLALTPALGEDSPAGNWYMSLADVTLGYILLNEDGTAIVNVSSEEEISGTWTSDGETVTITAENEPLDFAYDGTSLSSELLPISLTREEGKLPLTVVAAMMNGTEYTLPEGMTDIELASIAMSFMAEYTKLMQNMGGEGGTAAAPELTIEKENFKIIKSYSGYSGVYIAKVKNDTGMPIYITDGSMQLTDSEGKMVGEAKYLYPIASKYLEPGESTFVSMQADLEDNAEVNVTKNIVVKSSGYGSDYALTVENPTYIKGESEYDSDTMKVTVFNNTDQPLPGIEVVMVLEDAEGNLLFMSTESLYRYELGPNSSITLVSSVDNKLREYLTENGIEPATVEAFAWVENNDW